jgi:hypothetical protein
MRNEIDGRALSCEPPIRVQLGGPYGPEQPMREEIDGLNSWKPPMRDVIDGPYR